jgi:8-oxo-dGTP pyrophosphatase MutT (NUDIX family)
MTELAPAIEGSSRMHEPIPTWTFALAVIRSGDRALLVQERKHGGGWYLPGGRVEPGESLETAALRETLEEGGIVAELDAIHRVQYTPIDEGYARLRVIFLGHPIGGAVPKSIPDEHSLAAQWFSLAEASELPLRDPEVLRILREVGTTASAVSMNFLEQELV